MMLIDIDKGNSLRWNGYIGINWIPVWTIFKSVDSCLGCANSGKNYGIVSLAHKACVLKGFYFKSLK